MGTLLRSLRRCFLLSLVFLALWLKNAHVPAVLAPEHEGFAKMVALKSAKVSEQVKSRLSAKGFSTASIDRLQKCTFLCGRSVQTRLEAKILWLLMVVEFEPKPTPNCRSNSHLFPLSGE